MGTSSLISRNNTTGAYTVRQTHRFTSSYSTAQRINTASSGAFNGTLINSGTGSALSGSRDVSGTSYAATTVTATWYYWLQGASWYLDNQTSFSYTVPAAVFSITFDHNDGTGTTETVSRTYGTAWNAPTPTKSGYAFLGWFTAAEGGTQVDVSGNVQGTTAGQYTNGLTLYAHWEAMSILHVAEGGETKTVTNIQTVEGGRVKIRIESRKHPKRPDVVQIIVKDDGIGYRADQTEYGEGLRNIEERLRMQCGGSLHVTSTPGEGTTAEILLPQ